jgi:hypothetical protein
MKKPILLLFLAPFLFSCSLITPVNDVEVHNLLVAKTDNLKETENAFYKAYRDLTPGDDIANIKEKYKDFDFAINDLDDFFSSTKFASYQQVFVAAYDDFYKDFVFDYVSLSGSFISELESGGVVFDTINKYASDLDEYSINFVDFHNRLINIINQQADEK